MSVFSKLIDVMCPKHSALNFNSGVWHQNTNDFSEKRYIVQSDIRIGGEATYVNL